MDKPTIPLGDAKPLPRPAALNGLDYVRYGKVEAPVGDGKYYRVDLYDLLGVANSRDGGCRVLLRYSGYRQDGCTYGLPMAGITANPSTFWTARKPRWRVVLEPYGD